MKWPTSASRKSARKCGTLDTWFKQGIDTPGLTLIKVHAERLHYWDGFGEGELDLTREKAAEQA